ncbi:MAG: phosphohydrolase [Patescibacteria group bacterium]|nr:phosphohydrolase [Patescibacteria group bacterium]
MNREEAYQILFELVKNPSLIKHHLACEAVMKALYRRLNNQINQQDEEKWGLVGLLHDADYELSHDHPEKHSLILEEKYGNVIPQDVMYAIKCHDFENTKVEPKSLMDWSIYCCDELTGIIIASTLIHPASPDGSPRLASRSGFGEAGGQGGLDKKLVSVTPDFVLNRFNEKSFARSANRNSVKRCEDKLGIPLLEFIAICLNAMKMISNELGL